nr:uncharacterized protein LOC112776789 isoform X2 [Arachis hypogaea]
MKNSMSCFSFALLFTFLLSTQVLTHKIPDNEERIPAHSNVAWSNELEGSTSGSIGYHLPNDYFQEANPSLVPNTKKGHYTIRLVGYTPSDYQLDKTIIDINFPGGRINFPWPFTSSMFVAPKTEASPLYTTTTTSTSYYPANQYPSYLGDTVMISETVSEVHLLSGGNYKEWKDKILFHLGCADFDYALCREESPTPTDTSSQAEVALYERWEKSNRLSMMFIKSRISASIRGSIPDCRNVKDYMKAIDEQFESSSKALASTLMAQLTSMRLTSVRGVREHIMRLRDITTQLKALEVEISDSFLVHLILNSLPAQYGPFKISYNTHKEKWSINELLVMCVQEEGRLIQKLGKSALLVTNEGSKKQAHKKKEKGIVSHPMKKEGARCFFCKKKRHMKKECPKFKVWLEKKGFHKEKETDRK